MQPDASLLPDAYAEYVELTGTISKGRTPADRTIQSCVNCSAQLAEDAKADDKMWLFLPKICVQCANEAVSNVTGVTDVYNTYIAKGFVECYSNGEYLLEDAMTKDFPTIQDAMLCQDYECKSTLDLCGDECG